MRKRRDADNGIVTFIGIATLIFLALASLGA